MKLEELIEFLSSKGIEAPEGATLDDVLNIIRALAGAGDSGDEETKTPKSEDNPKQEESKADSPIGIS